MRFLPWLLFIVPASCWAGTMFGDWGKEIDAALDFLHKYGLPFMGTFGSSLSSWRIVNKLKIKNQEKYHFKPHPLYMDIAGFMIVIGISFWSWRIYGLSLETNLLICSVVGMFHTSFVKLFFKYAPKPAVEFVQDGIPVDEDGNVVTKLAATMLFGTKKGQRKAGRPAGPAWDEAEREVRMREDDPTRQLTQAEIDEITDRRADLEH